MDGLDFVSLMVLVSISVILQMIIGLSIAFHEFIFSFTIN